MNWKNSVRRRAAFAGVVLAGVTLAGMAVIPASADEPEFSVRRIPATADQPEFALLTGPDRVTEEEALEDLTSLSVHCRDTEFGPNGGEVVSATVEEVHIRDDVFAHQAWLTCESLLKAAILRDLIM